MRTCASCFGRSIHFHGSALIADRADRHDPNALGWGTFDNLFDVDLARKEPSAAALLRLWVFLRIRPRDALLLAVHASFLGFLRAMA